VNLVHLARTPAAIVTIALLAAAPARASVHGPERCAEGDQRDEARLAPILDALAAAPTDAGHLYCLADWQGDPVWSVALHELAYVHASELPDDTRAALAAQVLDDLAQLGLATEFLAFLRALPPDLRRRVLRREETALELSGLRFELDAQDFRLDFEAARRVAGEAPRPPLLARSDANWTELAAAPPPIANLQSELLARLVEAPADDPFALLLGWRLRTHSARYSAEDRVPELLWVPLVAEYARREGYAGLAATLLRELTWRYEPSDDWSRSSPGRRRLPAELGAAFDAWYARARARNDALARAAGEPIQPAWSATTTPWRIEPSASLPAAAPGWSACSPELVTRVSAGWPPDVSFVRCEQQAAEIVALALSTRLDPIVGSYWALRSGDGGRNWEARFTGIQAGLPFGAVAASTQPLVRSGGLALEVELVPPGDSTSRYWFPPTESDGERPQMLWLPWEALGRDLDEDGVTDLAEPFLMTDPRVADTDRDGLADGMDPLPGIPFAPRSGAPASLFEALIRGMDEPQRDAVLPSPPAAALAAASAARADGLLRVPCTIVEGEPLEWQPFAPRGRLLVLTSGQLERLYLDRPSFRVLTIRPLLVDRAGRRAYAEWGAIYGPDNGRGGALLVERTESGWRTVFRRPWIA
jgi:hypothetical protein